MKQCIILIGFLLVLIPMSINAQTPGRLSTADIEPYHIAVTYYKTSNIIFPYTIKSVDRGSDAILVQKAKGVDNILQVKAAGKEFMQTNLSIVTADGRFYSFLVDYSNDPVKLNTTFISAAPGLNRSLQPAVISDMAVDAAALQAAAAKIETKKAFLHKHVSEQEMKLSLQGIYVDSCCMWFDLQLNNKTLINYTPGYVRFFIRDHKRSKRTAVQENELVPIYSNADSVVTGGHARRLTVGFPAFTISPSQRLVVQVGERNGRRTLELTIKNKTILKARSL